MSIFAYQPFKGVYTLLAVSFELARMPIWIFKYVFKSGRQHPNLDFRKALGLRFLYSFLYHSSVVQVKTPLPHTPGKEKERFTMLKESSPDLYKGPLASNEDVKPTTIGATWYPAPLTAAADKSTVKVILHIHGGAFVIGDGRTEASGYFSSKLLKARGVTHVLCPQYRLSTLPASRTSNPFPAALQDTLTSYLYLLNALDVPTSNIIISGDSAGANLAIALLRYISEYGSDLNIPAPSACLLWSPWVHPIGASNDAFTRDNKNYGTDYISWRFTQWGTQAYAGLSGLPLLKSPYISHNGHLFKTETPIWVNTCEKEVLYFEDMTFADEMKAKGNNVTVYVQDHAAHDILLVGNLLGFDKEADTCAKKAGEWLHEIK